MVMKLSDFSHFVVWQIKTFWVPQQIPSVSRIQACTRNWYNGTWTDVSTVCP